MVKALPTAAFSQKQQLSMFANITHYFLEESLVHLYNQVFFCLFFVETRGKRVVCTEQVLSRVCLFCKFPSSVALLSCLKMSPEENLVVEQADNHLKQHNNGIVCFSMCSSDV